MYFRIKSWRKSEKNLLICMLYLYIFRSILCGPLLWQRFPPGGPPGLKSGKSECFLSVWVSAESLWSDLRTDTIHSEVFISSDTFYCALMYSLESRCTVGLDSRVYLTVRTLSSNLPSLISKVQESLLFVLCMYVINVIYLTESHKMFAWSNHRIW